MNKTHPLASFCVALAFLFPVILFAQQRESVYSYTEAFDPFFYPTNGNE